MKNTKKTRVVIGGRVYLELKKFLINQAKKENRTLSNLIENILKDYHFKNSSPSSKNVAFEKRKKEIIICMYEDPTWLANLEHGAKKSEADINDYIKDQAEYFVIHVEGIPKMIE